MCINSFASHSFLGASCVSMATQSPLSNSTHGRHQRALAPKKLFHVAQISHFDISHFITPLAHQWWFHFSCSTLSHLKIDYHLRKNSCYGFSQFHFFLLIYSKNQLHRAFTVFIIFLFWQQIFSANLLFTRVCNSKPNDLHNSIDFVCVSSAFEWAIYKLTI